MSSVFPKNITNALSITEVSIMPKTTYIVCPREDCNALYKANEHNRKCTQLSYGKMCRTDLGYEHQLSHGKVRWKPFKKFKFIRPSMWLQHMFSSSEFVALIQRWKRRPISGDYSDIYDGEIWSDMDSRGFFNGVLMLNVDWFKPMKRSEYKVAAIMLTQRREVQKEVDNYCR